MSEHGGFARMVILVLLAVACAAVSNLAASRERKMSWVGSYSRSLEVAPASSAAAGNAAPAAVPTLVPATPAAPAATAVSATASTTSPAASTKSFLPHPDRASVEIGTEDAERLFREGRLFLDARRTSAYVDGHVKGARSMPVWESDIADRVKAFYEEGGGDRDQNAPIVIYCSGGDCEDSHMLAEKLYFVGFNNLLVDKDGFPGWQKRGLPVVKGPKP
jgi:rhodanese-related sulfurtransferase